jgi:hypothetical protein
MAIILDNCLTECSGGSPIYKFFSGCCCPVQCNLTNDTDQIVVFDNVTTQTSGGITVNDFTIDGNPVSLPLTFNAFETKVIAFNVCDAFTGNGDILLTLSNISETFQFLFCFESISPSAAINISDVNFGNVVIGQTKTKYVEIQDLAFCCNDFYQSGLVAPFANGSSLTICEGDGTQFLEITFSPTTVGSFNGTLNVAINECNFVDIVVYGNGVEFVPGGNPISGKKKIAQSESNPCMTGNVFKCEPFNPIVQRTVQKISRQMPGGGSGRGTKFSK